MSLQGGGNLLFRKKMERYCTYCVFAGKLNDDTLICRKCGIVPASHRCRRFRYDPLKRIPVKPKTQDTARYHEKDFSL